MSGPEALTPGPVGYESVPASAPARIKPATGIKADRRAPSVRIDPAALVGGRGRYRRGKTKPIRVNSTSRFDPESEVAEQDGQGAGNDLSPLPRVASPLRGRAPGSHEEGDENRKSPSPHQGSSHRDLLLEATLREATMASRVSLQESRVPRIRWDNLPDRHPLCISGPEALRGEAEFS